MTKIDYDLMRQRLAEGWPVIRIAKEQGCHRRYITIEMRRLGLDVAEIKPYQDPTWLREQKKLGKSDAVIARELGVCCSAVFNARKKYGIPGLHRNK